ncbi:hypothetical protein DYB32_007611 [Aphanomyces invadans]|uniref:Core-binding (CB) domain-containing protein n=1 Tax=Aphanomyces invadans TaxID=157072 RepID=A0A3R6VT81_9STRA|nr:hypothetical protein DYB32_007611 [Aphanomyces invadans]
MYPLLWPHGQLNPFGLASTPSKSTAAQVLKSYSTLSQHADKAMRTKEELVPLPEVEVKLVEWALRCEELDLIRQQARTICGELGVGTNLRFSKGWLYKYEQLGFPASKAAIEDAFLGANTKRTYSAYQRQFKEFCSTQKGGMDPKKATAADCTDFFHYLFSIGRKPTTVDTAKTALVSLFKEMNVSPNPAQEVQANRYVIGLQKYCRQNNLDDERKAYPMTVHDLSRLMDAFAQMDRFTGAMFLFSLSFLGCFRVSEVLSLRWCDLTCGEMDGDRYVSVRLRWHKKAKVTENCQVYHLLNEIAYPCLRKHWFCKDPQNGQYVALKDFPKESIRLDRRKFSERMTLATAFVKYPTYDQFESAYQGHTTTYSGC